MTERLPPVPEPFTPEERALAARLARLGPHGEPSPALDARILAAARAGLAAPAAPARKPARWPLAVGIAASVALAVGLAWQLRPLPEAVVYDEAASAAVAPEDMQAEVAVAPATTAAPAEPAPAAGAEAPPAAFRRAPEREAAVEQARATDSQGNNAAPDSRQERYRAPPAPAAPPPPPPPPAPAPPRVVPQPPPAVEHDAGVAADVVALPAPPPPTPATATQAAKAAARVASPSPQAVARDAAARREQAAAEARSEASAAEAAAQDTFADEPFVEDVPPATADSPMVRDAWLHRIRELHVAGDTDAARASLQEFVRRYPDFPVPDDLRPLID